MTNNYIYRWSKLVSESCDKEGTQTTLAEEIEQQNLTLKEWFKKAEDEGGELKITFWKVTDGNLRVAIFSTASGKSCHFQDRVKVSPKVLKAIDKDHNRTYSQYTEYLGSLVTFPEKVPEPKNKEFTKGVQPALGDREGSYWQWRRLYVEQIERLEYDGRVVWENKDALAFSLVGRNGDVLTTITKDEYDEQQRKLEDDRNKYVRDNAARQAHHKKVVEAARKLSEQDCSVDLGWSNAWDWSDEDAVIARDAIIEKHNQLCHQKPEKHQLCIKSSFTQRDRGFDHFKCKGCDFGYSTDSSDYPQ